MKASDKRLAALAAQVAEIRELVDRTGPRIDVTVPDIIEFCLSPGYLNLPNIYPRQATLLKLMFLQDELFTEYDLEVIGEWGEGFVLPDTTGWDPAEPLFYEGQCGLAPDVLDRAAALKAAGHLWFPETYPAVGRRGSKGLIGGIAGAYVTFNLLALGCPQEEMGIAPTKTLAGLVFAGNRKQARDMQWYDIAETIVRAPCFAPFIVDVGREHLTLATPADRDRSGGVTDGSIQILAKEATASAGRGYAAYMVFFDELAHVSPTTTKTSSEDLVENTVPALDQCGKWAFTYAGSSPWQKIGAFHDNFRRGLQVDPYTHAPIDPEVLSYQLPSWAPYEDWDLAHKLATIPRTVAETRTGYTVDGNPVMRIFPRLTKAIQAYDEKLQRRERRNPARFAVEYRAQWATVMAAFLNPAMIADMFRGRRGQPLTERAQGQGSIEYHAHGDAASTGDNFVWMIAHYEQAADEPVGHVVIDKIRVWRPGDYPDGHVPYLEVYARILEDFKNFDIVDATFDQYQATMIVELLRDAVRKIPGRTHASIREIAHTRSSNRAMADVFLHALNNGQVHCYPHELLDQELRHLQDINGKVDHPSSGPVQTNDSSTCAMVLVERLVALNADHKVHRQLGGTGLSGFMAGSLTAADRDMQTAFSASRGGPQVAVGERAYPGGPKRLPRWAGG